MTQARFCVPSLYKDQIRIYSINQLALIDIYINICISGSRNNCRGRDVILNDYTNRIYVPLRYIYKEIILIFANVCK